MALVPGCVPKCGCPRSPGSSSMLAAGTGCDAILGIALANLSLCAHVPLGLHTGQVCPVPAGLPWTGLGWIGMCSTFSEPSDVLFLVPGADSDAGASHLVGRGFVSTDRSFS